MKPRHIKRFGEKCTLDVMHHIGIGYTINHMIIVSGEITDVRDITYNFIETEEEAIETAKKWAKEYDENVYDCYTHYEKLNPACWDCVYLNNCKRNYENEYMS